MDVWTWGGGKREAGVNWEISIDTYTLPCVKQASLVVQMVKNLPVVWETWVQSLGREDALEEGPATHSSILAWRIPWTVEPGGLQSMGEQRVWHDWATKQRTCVKQRAMGTCWTVQGAQPGALWWTRGVGGEAGSRRRGYLYVYIRYVYVYITYRYIYVYMCVCVCI